MKDNRIKKLKSKIKEEIIKENDRKITISDISQSVSFLSVYGLNSIGIKAKNNFKDRTIILGTAYLIMGTTVTRMKELTKIGRPDGSSKNSFPSGHTATAFMGAETGF